MFVLYYPPGTILVNDEAGRRSIENRTLAKQILEGLAWGKDVLIPQLVDEHGNKLWVLEAWTGDGKKHVSYEATANAGVLTDVVQPQVEGETAPHRCEGDLPHANCGPAIVDCVEKDGKLWAGNGEYDSLVNFCPYCGFSLGHAR